MNRRAGRRSGAPDGAEEWTRQRLLAALSLLAVLSAAVLAGAVLWVWFLLHPHPALSVAAAGAASPATQATAAAAGGTTAGGPTAQAAVQARRDVLAVAPMRAADPAAAQPAVLSVRDPGSIDLPASTGAGPVGIPTGFPHTPQGAFAQLVAVDTDVLNTATVDHARQVIAGWAVPGGPTGESWSAVRALAGFHSAAGLSGGPSPGLSMQATPMMGLVKATDGPDWAVVCVDFEVDATLARTARIAAADCQRMAWDGSRWLLGPGVEPALAPSIWPGTDAAINAGFRNLRRG